MNLMSCEKNIVKQAAIETLILVGAIAVAFCFIMAIVNF